MTLMTNDTYDHAPMCKIACWNCGIMGAKNIYSHFNCRKCENGVQGGAEYVTRPTKICALPRAQKFEAYSG